MERIKEAIRLAKMSRGHADTVTRDSMPPARAPITGTPTPAAEPHQPRPVPTLHTNRHHLEENRIIGHMSENVQASAYDILRTKVLQEMDQEGWKVLVITSPTQACGKTLTAINLALSMSKLPSRSVCLIDLDLRRPSISKHLGVEIRHSLAEYANGEAGLEDIQFHVDIGGTQLTLICNDSPIRNPAEVIASQPIADLLNYLRSRPDQPIIIVDLPPLLVSDDVITFLPMADCSVMTVVENVTTNRDIESSEELLAPTNMLGCVLNKSSDSAGSYYY